MSFESPRQPVFSAGKLRQRISIVMPSPTQDSTGGISLLVNVLWANLWASIEAVSGTETLAGQSFMNTITHRIILRYIGSAPSWLASTTYLGNALIKDSNGNLQQAQSGGGTSGTTAPTWSTVIGQFTSDGDPSLGITWKNLGPAPSRTGINASMQVQYKGRQFQITAVLNPDERSKMLCLMCTEINDSLQQNPLLPGSVASYPNTSLVDTVNNAVGAAVDAAIADIDVIDGGE